MFLEGSRLYKCCGRPEVRALTDAEEGKVDPAANGCKDICQKCQVLQLFLVFFQHFFHLIFHDLLSLPSVVQTVWGERGSGEAPGCVMIRHPDAGLQGQHKGYEFAEKEHELEDL